MCRWPPRGGVPVWVQHSKSVFHSKRVRIINIYTQFKIFKHVGFYAFDLKIFLYQTNAHQIKSKYNELS